MVVMPLLVPYEISSFIKPLYSYVKKCHLNAIVKPLKNVFIICMIVSAINIFK